MDNEKTMHFSASYGKSAKREGTITVGKKYTISPLNPQKKHNRGRNCIVLDFVPVSEFHPHDMVAKIKFLDNNRVGRADFDELEPILNSD